MIKLINDGHGYEQAFYLDSTVYGYCKLYAHKPSAGCGKTD